MSQSNDPNPRRDAVLDIAVAATFLALVFVFGCFRQKDADIWWHLKAGEMILESGSVPRKDSWTFTSSHREWVDLHWLFQVAAARVYALGGMKLLTLAAAATATAALGIQLLMRRAAWPVAGTVLCWYPFLFLLSGRLYVRPEVLTLLCLSLYLVVFFHAERHPKWLWALVPVQLFWVNVQGLFVLGLILAAAYWVDGAWRHVRGQTGARLAARTGLCMALVIASMVNPYGLRGLLFPLELFEKMGAGAIDHGVNFYSQHISELQSIPQFIAQAGYLHFYVLVHFSLLGLLALSFLAVWWRGRFDVFRALSGVAFAWLSMQATRNSGQFALVAGSITAWNFGEWMSVRREAQSVDVQTPIRGGATGSDHARSRSARGTMAFRFGLCAVFACTIASLVNDSFYRLAGEGRRFGLGEHPLWHAHDAARFAAQDAFPTRMLAFHLGQAAVFEFHMRDDQRVFCDPRLEVMSRELFAEYHDIEAAIAQDQSSWMAALERHGVEMILADHTTHFRLEATLLSNPQWRCVYFDAVAAVYRLRDAGEAHEVAEVDFAARLFQPMDAMQGRRGAVAADDAPPPGEPDSRMHEATALYLIARNMSERPQFDLDRARAMLFLALHRARAGHAADTAHGDRERLLGQIHFSLSPFTGRRLADASAFSWEQARMLDLARSRWWLQRVLEQRPNDFVALAHLYHVAQFQLDRETQLEAGDRLVRLGRGRLNRRAFADLVSQELQSLRREKRTDTVNVPDATATTPADEIRLATRNDLAAGQLKTAMNRLLNTKDRLGGLPWEFAHQMSSLCAFLGQPERAWIKQDIEGEFDEAVRLTYAGDAQLVMNQFAKAIEHYQAALRLKPEHSYAHLGLARIFIEEGDAASALRHSRLALDDPQLSADMRHQAEWMIGLIERFAAEPNAP